MKRSIIVPFIWIACAFACGSAFAETWIMKLGEEETAWGSAFLEQPSGQVGVVTRDCQRTGLTGRRTHLVRENVVYWSVGADCIRVIVNHRATVPDDQVKPTFLGVQVIGFYGEPPRTSLVLRRTGPFTRGNATLSSWDDRQFSPDETDHAAWDQFSSGARIEDFDARYGPWHGKPLGSPHDSWDQRHKFQTSRICDPRLNVKHKMLDNRLIRFTPYSAESGPQEGPVGFDVRRKGAQAVAIRIFSPASADYDRSFLLIYETDREAAGKIVNFQIAQNGFFARFFGR